MKDKYELYQEQGVREYWVVRPEEGNIYILKEGKYIGIAPVVEGDIVTLVIFPMLIFNTEGLYEM